MTIDDTLCAHDRDRFIDLVQACASPSIDEAAFRRILRHHLKALLPHGCAIAVVASLNIDQIELHRTVSVDYPEAFVAGLPRFTNLRQRPLVEQWLKTRSPVIVDPESPNDCLSNLERREIESFALGRMAIHGQIDITSRMASYFSFARIDADAPHAKISSILKIVTPHLHGALMASSPPRQQWSTTVQLTAAEFDILRLLAKGCTNSDIAKARGRSVSTIRNQLHALYEKLEVSGRAEAVARFGSTAGVVDGRSPE